MQTTVTLRVRHDQRVEYRFDWALRGRARPLLRGESTRFPEVDFQL
jgi:hypothetical protein